MGWATAAKRRPRLVEAETEAFLRRRGGELIGLAIALVGAAALALVQSYSPEDPSIFSATDARPQNALGLLGASIADPLCRAIGLAAFAPGVILVVWGVRLIIHQGEERVLTRLVLAPIATAILSIFAAAHVPPASWPHAYGLGGLLGDSALDALIVRVPLPLASALLVMTLALAVAASALTLLALGVDGREFRAILRYIWTGLLQTYGALFCLTGALLRGAARVKARPAPRTQRAERREPKLRRSADAAGDQPGDAEDALARVAAAVRAREGISDVEDPPRPALRVEPLIQHAERRPPKGRRALEEEQPRLALEDPVSSGFEVPPLALLQNADALPHRPLADDALEENARMLETVLDDYGVKGEIIAVRPGPVVTMYELEPAAGVKASRVIGLADDIARSMSALAARVSTIPGRSVIGIELPNDHREKVILREILSSRDYDGTRFSLPLALGKDIGGEPVVANLAKMPHLLIAGTTGSGKSVAINTMILSLLYKLRPDECRMIMIDPKMLELSVYDGIPHLLSPVVTDPKKAVVALKWVVAEMEERYRKMSKMGVRNVDGYNARVRDALAKGEAFTRTVQTGFDDATGEPLFETEEYAPELVPYIVVVVDEMADLMMVAGKEIEACIQRLAQMARASGIHIVMATQRPSVDVITGTIKANFPTRISFQVTSKVDSRTILGEMGAEQLLGMGDMLYMAGGGRITRVHGPFVSDEEVEEVVRHLKLQGAPEYVSGVVEGPDDVAESQIDAVLGLGGNTGGEEALYDQAVAIVARDRKCSTSYIQRKLAIGYNKAARLVEQMEDEGVVGPSNSVGKREILVPEA